MSNDEEQNKISSNFLEYMNLIDSYYIPFSYNLHGNDPDSVKVNIFNLDTDKMANYML